MVAQAGDGDVVAVSQLDDRLSLLCLKGAAVDCDGDLRGRARELARS